VSHFIHTVQATTLPDLWFQLIYDLMRGNAPHEVYTITSGSYVGQKRLEYRFLVAEVAHPESRPLIPDIPPGLGIPAPVEDMEYVENYFAQYLMNPDLEPNETYKYASWLAPGVERVIDQLKGSPGNNQAAISVGGWVPAYSMPYESVVKQPRGICTVTDTDNFIDPGTGERDPACLRTVDFRYDQDGLLHMMVYFRSWDLFAGLPANLAGLQLLKEYVAEGVGATPGKTICASKGLHIYSHFIDVAAQRLGMTDVASMDDFLAYIKGASDAAE